MISKTLMKYRKEGEDKGDTIIEVLISVAIVGLVIAAAYALASNSLQQGITASERTEALKLAEAQIEHLKLRHRVDTRPVFYETNNFCLGTSASNSDDDGWDPIINNINPSSPATNLVVATAGGLGYTNTPIVRCVSPATSPKYFINITIPMPLDTPSNPNPTYLVTVRWNAIGGGQNQSQLYYRF